MKKRITALLLLLALLVSSACAAELPYQTYNYDHWGDTVFTPAAYAPVDTLTGVGLTWQDNALGSFKSPQDVCVAPDGRIYLADSGNNRIVVMNAALTQVENVIAGFDNYGYQDTFSTPTGVAVDAEGNVYVADSLNHRIVALDAQGKLLRIIEMPALQSSVSLTGGVTARVDTLMPGVTKAEENPWLPLHFTQDSMKEIELPDGRKLKVAAHADELQPLMKETEDRSGAHYAIAADGKSIVRTGKDGASFTFAKYDATTNLDVFLLIGRLIKGNQNIRSLTSLIGLWVDDDCNLYCISAKSVVVLDAEGKMVANIASYDPMDGAKPVTFASISAFAVQGDELFIRDGENHILVMDKLGATRRIIQSNALLDSDGMMLTGFEKLLGIARQDSSILAAEESGAVYVLSADGERLAVLNNNSAADASLLNGCITHYEKNGEKLPFDGVTDVFACTLDNSGERALCVTEASGRMLLLNGQMQLLDMAQNNCVSILDRDGNVIRQIYGAEGESFAQMQGVLGVAKNSAGQLCIGDSRDTLIVTDREGNFLRRVVNPDNDVLEAGFELTPLKVSVDYAGRVYCIARNMFEGIMVFETNGDFTGFFGTIKVQLDLWQKFWRRLATKEERSRQQLFIPTEFTGIDIDDEGFVYASNKSATGTQSVRRLNPRGEDVIRNAAMLIGDLNFEGKGVYAGPSQFVDVVYREKGIYSLLDSRRGRIFTYDHEGNLLYIFGGLGTQAGTFQTPVALEYAGDRLLALDARQNALIIFGETEYGRLINEAVGLRYDGDESEAIALWNEVLRLDENNELANVGIGKAYLAAGDNDKAMEYLKRGMSRSYYSVAFKRARNETLKQSIPNVLTAVMTLVVLGVLYTRAIKPIMAKKRQKKGGAC